MTQDELVERVALVLFNGNDAEWAKLDLMQQLVFLTQARRIIPIVQADQRERDAEVRAMVAALHCASGCSCCRDDTTWEAATNWLGKALGVPEYEDGSGFDFYAVRDENKDLIATAIRKGDA